MSTYVEHQQTVVCVEREYFKLEICIIKLERKKRVSLHLLVKKCIGSECILSFRAPEYIKSKSIDR